MLSGVAAAFLAHGLDAFQAACVAVEVHREAGRVAGRRLGAASVIAGDVIDALPAVLQRGSGGPATSRLIRMAELTVRLGSAERVRARAHVDLGAVERNCALLKRHLGRAHLCAVVKADGYGHGATSCARAALAGGATWLAVATAAEAAELRADGIGAPLLVMGALTDAELEVALEADADVVAWSESFLRAVEAVGLGAGPRAREARHRHGPARHG